MGLYLNPGNEQFSIAANSDYYVDKTDLAFVPADQEGLAKR